MPDSVFVPIGITEISEAEEQPSKTYRLDLDNGRIYGYVDGQEAVRQAIRKALITPRWKCLIYDNQYGSEIEDAVTVNDATREYVRSVVPGFVRDCLKPDSRILDVSNFTFDFRDDRAYIGFDADTIFGRISIEEVI